MDRREGNGEFKKKTKGKTIVFLAEDKAHEPPPPTPPPTLVSKTASDVEMNSACVLTHSLTSSGSGTEAAPGVVPSCPSQWAPILPTTLFVTAWNGEGSQ